MAEVSASALAELYAKAKDRNGDAEKCAELLAEYERLVDSLPISYIGPTWRRNEAGKWDLPERTLGWEIALWCAEYLQGKGGGPWMFTKEQLRFVLWWYAVDESGKFTYRTGVLQRIKGWGKDPLMAVLCLVEFVGPSQFSHWDEDGNPVAMAHPDAWVQIAATSREQTKNTLTVFPGLMSKRLISDYGIKPGSELFRAELGRKRMEPVTSNPATIEGGRSTFVCLNETQHWREGNHGHEMYATIEGNITKIGARYLAITNAYLPGQDSVAERMREAYQDIVDGRAYDVGFLYDSVEADPRAPMTPEAMRIILPKVRGDSVWVPIEDTIQSALFGARAVSRSRRMYYNQIVAEEDALYSDVEWKACEDRDAMLAPKDKIVLGFDGGKTEDATALVAIRVKDMLAVPIGIWEKEHDGWEIDRAAVNSKVHETFRTYEVVGFYADVALWENSIIDWHETYGEGLVVKATATGNSIAWDMRQSRKKVTLAHERLINAILGARLRHNGNPDLRRHILNVRRRDNEYGTSFGKESKRSDKKIDAYAAMLLAFEALNDYRTRKKTEPQGGAVWLL